MTTLDPLHVDVYFSPSYGKLCEMIEGGTLETFSMRSDHGSVLYQFIQRPIPDTARSGLVDIITPYGYGGPLVQADSPRDREHLIQAFHDQFASYCRDAHVVSEFIRFHPIERNHLGMEGGYLVSTSKKTLATNLQDFGDPFTGEFTKKCRRTIRKCEEAGIRVDLDFSGATIHDFLDIYSNTMTRKEARSFYYFNRQYFEALVEELRGHCFVANARLDGVTIASGVYLYNDTYIHAHLSGTLTEYLSYSPASLIKKVIADWGHEHGQHYFHHGGGYTNGDDDGLFKFKKSFCANTEFDFYVGRKIRDEDAYAFLAREAGVGETPETGFFPAYRSRA